ncbi:MAG: hypothetical protein WKF81_06145 [Thermomicrobiales bacterium]
MTDATQATTNENGKVLMMSTVMAGIAGGVGAFLRSRNNSSKEQQILSRMVEDRKSELAELNSALESRRKDLSDLMSSAGKNSRKAIKDLNVSGSDLSNVDWTKLSRKARKGIERARSEAVKHAPSDLNGRRDSLMKSGEEAAKTARSLGTRVADQLSSRIPELMQTVESELGPRAQSMSERASGIASTASRDAAEVVRHRAEDLRPQLDDLASRARDAARHGADEARPRLDDLASWARDAARHGADEARPRFEDIAAKTKSVVAGAPDAFTTEFHRADDLLSSFAHGVQERTADAAHLVEDKSKSGAKAVQQGSKDGTSLLFWLGAAGAAIYFVILSDEQREKVKHIASRIFSEAKEVYADIQGEDGKF